MPANYCKFLITFTVMFHSRSAEWGSKYFTGGLILMGNMDLGKRLEAVSPIRDACDRMRILCTTCCLFQSHALLYGLFSGTASWQWGFFQKSPKSFSRLESSCSVHDIHWNATPWSVAEIWRYTRMEADMDCWAKERVLFLEHENCGELIHNPCIII